ncbi:anti-sigma factor RsbA family regulatory protein [Phycicoccus avicenniae]|uniref:anti-sigma factor RsbA family regulatory protein n=1 Tax=Phycicoccus avicenniae TaxID=2828860 RepID=UPI003D2A0FFD
MTGHPVAAGWSEGDGYHHGAAIYSSDEQFVDQMGVFIGDGIARGEPVVLALSMEQEALLTSAGVGLDARKLGANYYRDPLSALSGYRTLVSDYIQAGSARVRLVGDLPSHNIQAWDGWARYEASCNHFLADLPALALCTYDTRTSTPIVLSDAARVHPFHTASDGRQVSASEYVPPVAFLEEWTGRTTDRLEVTAPALVLTDPVLGAARQAVARLATRFGVPESGLVLAVSEVVANAQRHGRPPVTVRAWGSPGRVVVTVTDEGPGPTDPFAGLLSPDLEATDGRGLWMAHYLCDVAAISLVEGRCTVRLVASAATPDF